MENINVPDESQTHEAQPITNTYQVAPQKGLGMQKAGIGIILLIIALAGVGTGFGLSKLIAKPSAAGTEVTGAPGTLQTGDVAVGKVYGVEDAKKYPDSSEGVIEKGGMEGEGTHHLVRPGGNSQTVYLTSSVLDLDLFVGHKVLVKGETFSAQKAAWFMDVASVKVMELNASKANQAEPGNVTE